MSALKLGFLPLVDSSPLIVARELGFDQAAGIRIELRRERSWSNLRDRLAVGALDASHLLAPLALAMPLGLSGLRVPVIAAMLINRGGNTVCVAPDVADAMGAHGRLPEAPAAIGALLRETVTSPLRIAVPYFFSSHHYLMRYWLGTAGFGDGDIELKIVPPPYMIDMMTAGEIDAFVVGEPWGSLAVDRGVAAIAVPTVHLSGTAPEKVLAMTRSFAEERRGEAIALIRAVAAAARWCGEPRNHAILAELLARRDYLDVPAEIIGRALSGWLTRNRSGMQLHVPEFLSFHGEALNRPEAGQALWLHREMVRWGHAKKGDAGEASAVFDASLYDEALPAALTQPV